MASSAKTLPYFEFHSPVAVGDYLNEEIGAATKSEFIDGYVFAMAGTTDWHNMVAMNLVGLLNQRLPDRCHALGLDVKLQIKTQSSERYYYPDTFVTCGAPLRNEHVHTEALLIAEVLSPTTERYDRGEKMMAYRFLPTLQEYILVWPDAPIVEIRRRSSNWEHHVVKDHETLKLESVGVDIQLAELYRRVPVTFAAQP
jgi:Uma2 family endonuclease